MTNELPKLRDLTLIFDLDRLCNIFILWLYMMYSSSHFSLFINEYSSSRTLKMLRTISNTSSGMRRENAPPPLLERVSQGVHMPTSEKFISAINKHHSFFVNLFIFIYCYFFNYFQRSLKKSKRTSKNRGKNRIHD